jgi:hypothetical protein
LFYLTTVALYFLVFIYAGHVAVAVVMIIISYFRYRNVTPAQAFMLTAGFLSALLISVVPETIEAALEAILVGLFLALFTRTSIRNRTHVQHYLGGTATRYYDQLTIYLWLLTATGVIALFPSKNDQLIPLVRSIAAWLVVLGVIPALSAPFVWCAVGITRGLLRRTGMAAGVVLSLISGVALALSVMVVLVVGVQAFNFAVGSSVSGPIIDVAGFVKTARRNPSDLGMWWVYVVLTLTLIPTLFYCIAVVGALITGEAPLRLRQWALDQVTAPGFERDPIRQRQVALFLTARSCAGVALGWSVLFALCYAFIAYTPSFGHFSLCVAEFAAAKTGVAVVGGPHCLF